MAAAIPVVASIAGGLLASQGAKSAANKQAKAYDAQAEAQRETNRTNVAAQLAAQERAMQWQQQMMDEARRQEIIQQQQAVAELAPYGAAGQNALYRYLQMAQAGPGPFIPEEQPGYKFGYQELYENPTFRKASATGDLRSGGLQKALGSYAQDYASNYYDKFLDRYYKSLEPWQTVMGQGANAAGGMASIYTGGQMPSIYGQAGQTGASMLSQSPSVYSPDVASSGLASAMGSQAQSNIFGNMISNIPSQIVGAMNNGAQSANVKTTPSYSNIYSGYNASGYGPPR